MVHPNSVSSRLPRSLRAVGALAFLLGACGGDGDGNDGATGGESSGGSSGGSVATGGQTGTGGVVASGGQGPTGGTTGGNETGGAASGGGSSGGSAGNATGGTGTGGDGTGGAFSGECTRDLLDGLLDEYFAALGAGDPSSLPLADTVKFTENAEESTIGSTAFWMNAGDAKYSQRALDTEECTVAAHAVIPEGTTDLPVGIRIKVEGGLMTEIETIVARQGDYTASFAVNNDTDAIIAMDQSVGWHDEVPEGQRASREQLTGWMEKYFRAFPNGVCDVTAQCIRLENGGGNFSCGGQSSCSASDTSTTGFPPRLIVADEVRGIAVGLTIFDFQQIGHLDMHMMKMSGGQVHAVHAILRDTEGESGWD